MVPKKARLPREEFAATGYRRVTSRFFSIKSKKNDVGGNRIGVIIGKSVDKRATRRNFLERKVKSELLLLPNMNKDFIVTVFPGVNMLLPAEFHVEIKKILKQII